MDHKHAWDVVFEVGEPIRVLAASEESAVRVALWVRRLSGRRSKAELRVVGKPRHLWHAGTEAESCPLCAARKSLFDAVRPDRFGVISGVHQELKNWEVS